MAKLTKREELAKIAEQFKTRVEVFTATFEDVGAEIEQVQEALENMVDYLQTDVDFEEFIECASLDYKRKIFNILLAEFVPADDLRRVVEMVLKTVAPRWANSSSDKKPKKKK